MAQQAFGGAHTAKKLDKLEAYLRAYLNVFEESELGAYDLLRCVRRYRQSTDSSWGSLFTARR